MYLWYFWAFEQRKKERRKEGIKLTNLGVPCLPLTYFPTVPTPAHHPVGIKRHCSSNTCFTCVAQISMPAVIHVENDARLDRFTNRNSRMQLMIQIPCPSLHGRLDNMLLSVTSLHIAHAGRKSALRRPTFTCLCSTLSSNATIAHCLMPALLACGSICFLSFSALSERVQPHLHPVILAILQQVRAASIKS